jgi:hypothetical protein
MSKPSAFRKNASRVLDSLTFLFFGATLFGWYLVYRYNTLPSDFRQLQQHVQFIFTGLALGANIVRPTPPGEQRGGTGDIPPRWSGVGLIVATGEPRCECIWRWMVFPS